MSLDFKKITMIVVLLLSFVFSCHGLLVDNLGTTRPQGQAHSPCYFPCNWLKKTYYNQAQNVDMATTDPHMLTVMSNPTLDIECYERSGSFIVRRTQTDHLYRCLKVVEICAEAYAVLQTPVQNLTTPPKLCDICSPEKFSITPEIWVVKARTILGCNIPKTCQASAHTGTRCDGSESHRPDDSTCGGHPSPYQADYFDRETHPKRDQNYSIRNERRP